MIKTFVHKGLKELWNVGRTRRIDAKFHGRLLERLDALDAAKTLLALNLPGYGLHELKGQRRSTWSISVSGAWRLTFRFDEAAGAADDVDFEPYH